MRSYFKRCWPNSEKIAKFDFVHVLAHEDKVFVTYEGTNNGGSRFRNTEILTIRQQKIVDAEVYFVWSVPHPAPELNHDGSRSGAVVDALHWLAQEQSFVTGLGSDPAIATEMRPTSN